MENKSQLENHTGSSKKTYRSPELSLYGDVSQITRSGFGGTADLGGTPGMTMPCWIAEALYGVDAPRTLLVRAWLMESYKRGLSWALVVVPLYSRFGERLAVQVRRHSFLQLLFRPLFDRAVRLAHREFAVRATLLIQAA